MGKMTLQQILMQLAGGMGTSIQIFAVTLVFSLPLGLFVALGRMSRNKILQAVIKVYISVMRGTPLMLQLLVVYFGPYYMFGMRVSNSYRLWAVQLSRDGSVKNIYSLSVGKKNERAARGLLTRPSY